MKPREQELAEQVFGNGEQRSMGATQALTQGLKEGLSAYVRGLVDVVYSPEMKQFAAHGAHEIYAGLFMGHGAVMYPRTANAKDDHGIHGPNPGLENKGLEHERHLERGGRGM